MTDPSPRATTVVVPIYGDLPSLLSCLRALQRTVDPAVASVLLVNDCGPQADEIEARVLELINGDARFRYERNDANLGFVGSCNRAALELDRSGNDVLLLNSDTIPTTGFIEELSAVLHERPDRGIVCARSDNATIASLPHRLVDPVQGRSRERTSEVFDAISDRLPRSTIVPVAMGFCFLVRRELIDRFGLFDDAFAPGYGEENDFCLRVREAGYHSALANHALVFHSVGASFQADRRARLRAAHERLLVERHPGYPELVQRYLRREADVVDVFADVLVPRDRPARILVLSEGSAFHAAALVAELRSRGLRVDASAGDAAERRRLGRRLRGGTVAYDDMSRIWDVALVLHADGLEPSPASEDVQTRSAPRAMVLACANWTAADLRAAADAVVQSLERRIDDAVLRDRWASNARRAEEAGVPLIRRRAAMSRIRASIERCAPAPVARVRRLMRSIRENR